MSNQQIKRGRKSKPFIAANGEHINGLRRRAHDNRWILSDGRTFAERDEQKAIERFRQMTEDAAALKCERLERRRVEHNQIGLSLGQIRDWVLRLILNTPLKAAKDLGIEWLAYGPELKAPEPLPTFAELEQIWRDNCKASAEQRRKVLHA